MSATEELRRLLDELGVKWHDGDAVTYWSDADALESIFRDGALDISLYGVAPAQAIEATLGKGKCRMTLRDDIMGHAYQDTYECSECGEYVVRETYIGESDPPRYCPNCGREVKP